MKTPIPSIAEREALMQIGAKKAVLESDCWLTAEELARRVHSPVEMIRAQLRDWEEKRQVFSICSNGIDYYPRYTLDDDFRPYPSNVQILTVLTTTKSRWAMAFWFASVSSYLGGKRPQDLLHIDPERTLAAAEDEAAGITHG